MINPKKLIKMARKWQRLAAIRRKRISITRSNGDVGTCSSSSNSSPVANKGHFVAYTADGKRFVFPIAYLNNRIFAELLKMSEEEFGLPNEGPITLPCDAVFMDYAISLILCRATTHDIEKALIISITTRCSLSTPLQKPESSHQLLVCGF